MATAHLVVLRSLSAWVQEVRDPAVQRYLFLGHDAIGYYDRFQACLFRNVKKLNAFCDLFAVFFLVTFYILRDDADGDAGCELVVYMGGDSHAC